MRRVSTYVSSGLLVLLLTAALPAATTLAGNAGWGWAIARHATTASYHPAAADYGAAYLTGTPTITRYGTGHYKVSFPGMGLPGGVAFVSPLGSSPRVCNVLGWFVHGSKQVIDVQCWSYSGNKANSNFAVYFVRGQDNLGPLAYSWNYSEAADVTLTGAYNFNSAAGVNSVDRLSTGHYRISAGGLGSTSGNAQVVAYGPVPGVCRVEDWGGVSPDQKIDVNCRSLGGQRRDMKFTFAFVDHVGLYGFPPADQSAGYVWANQESAMGYVPDTSYNWASDAPANRVARSAPGAYAVRMVDLAGVGGGALVTNYGSGTLRCQLGNVPTSGPEQRVVVLCFTPNGIPADSKFSFLFTR
jgi:hypothetical protein